MFIVQPVRESPSEFLPLAQAHKGEWPKAEGVESHSTDPLLISPLIASQGGETLMPVNFRAESANWNHDPK